MATSRLGVLLVATALLTATGTGAAQAAKVDGGAIHDDDTFTVPNFCGVTGLTVQNRVTVDGRFLATLRGKDKTFYYAEGLRVVQHLTNVATKQTATDIQPHTTSKDLHVVANGDGTTTITDLLTGGGRLYGDSGKLIAKDSGQIRIQFTVSDNGTPSDPNDDVEIGEGSQIFGSTGTNDDYCAAILENWGI